MDNYRKARDEAARYYASLGPVFCPALGEEVRFSRSGFQHIIHKKGRHVREMTLQLERFALLPMAPRLVGLTTTYQEYECSPVRMSVDHFGEAVARNKDVTHWGIIAILDKRKVKVILRKVGNGGVHFWSIIPNWKSSSARDEKYFSIMKGSPETD